TQIEHAPDNVGFLVGTDEGKLREVLAEAEAQVAVVERRGTLLQALQNGAAFLARDETQAAEIVDAIAPEHLSIATREPERWLGRIRNAGCILLGEWSPESAGDFVAGPSHTLPTAGAARFQSPVSALSFLKLQSVIRLSRDQLRELAPTIEAFGRMEGFPAHARGATIRFEEEA
ncbi:MAG: histidinol dehydrogenase, partial [Armatimonadetes bacterium]|nr:histidinol dehydrogenase [Armatimonadota bacterium]